MINQLINDYFNLTGRPIATMTVDEYLSFVKASNIQLPSIAVERPLIKDTIQSPTEELKAPVITSPPVATTKAKDESKNSKPKTKREPDQNDILKVLQSIAG